jgi:release factor glutamine methyltransferase
MRAAWQREALARLKNAGIEDAAANARWLAEHVQRVAGHQRPEDQTAHFRALLERRLQREPLQYVLGEWDFHNARGLRVRAPVLIPRPETEGLVELVLERLREREERKRGAAGKRDAKGGSGGKKGSEGDEDPADRLRVLEVGSGSGCVSVALALALGVSRVEVVALDVSAAACALTRENAELFGVQEAIDVRNVRAGEFRLDAGAAPFDAVVSNPPYVPRVRWAALQPEVRDWEDPGAVVGGEDGLDVVREILQACTAHRWMASDDEDDEDASWVALEVDADHCIDAPRLPDALGPSAAGWRVARTVPDCFGRPRFVIMQRGPRGREPTKPKQ